MKIYQNTNKITSEQFSSVGLTGYVTVYKGDSMIPLMNKICLNGIEMSTKIFYDEYILFDRFLKKQEYLQAC